MVEPFPKVLACEVEKKTVIQVSGQCVAAAAVSTCWSVSDDWPLSDASHLALYVSFSVLCFVVFDSTK